MPFDCGLSSGVVQGTSPTSLAKRLAHVLARDAAGGCHEAHGLPVAAVEGEGHAHALAVVAADLQAVRAPAGVARLHGNAPLVPALLAAGVALEQEPGAAPAMAGVNDSDQVPSAAVATVVYEAPPLVETSVRRTPGTSRASPILGVPVMSAV